jgi:hypothetical protein
VGPEFAHAFDKAMDREQTLYGTYVANTFGGGLARALKVSQPDGLARPQDVAEATVKMVVCAQHHRDQLPGVRSEWALGAQAPSLVVAAGRPPGPLSAPRNLENLLPSTRRRLPHRPHQPAHHAWRRNRRGNRLISVFSAGCLR